MAKGSLILRRNISYQSQEYFVLEPIRIGDSARGEFILEQCESQEWLLSRVLKFSGQVSGRQ